MRKLGLAFGIVLALWLAFTGVVYWAMRQPPARFGRFMKHLPMPAMIVVPFETLWMRARAGHLDIGDRAPDFALATADHQQHVRLADFRGTRPVVLVFGSYT